MNDKLQNALLQRSQVNKMIRGQGFTLQQAEPNLNLVQPGSILGQLNHLHGKRPSLLLLLLKQPGLQLFGRMGRAVIEDQPDFFDPALDRFGHNHLQKEGLKIGKTLAR
jgi:hypothetical protein